MTPQLVFIQGREREDKQAGERKEQLLAALRGGPAGRALPIPESDIVIADYEDVAAGLTDAAAATDDAEIIVRGEGAGAAERVFVREVLADMLSGAGVTEDVIREELPPDVIERGPLSWEWVHTGLWLLDRLVPEASGAMIAHVTSDIARYLLSSQVRRRVNRAVARAFADCQPRSDVVVVAHSLGTVIAYNLLRSEGPRLNFRVPLLVTLGSPLGVVAVRKSLMPLSYPTVVGRWFNAFDTRDVMAPHPLDHQRFTITPPIDNYGGVRNDSTNHHALTHYLRDPRVSDEIRSALG